MMIIITNLVRLCAYLTKPLAFSACIYVINATNMCSHTLSDHKLFSNAKGFVN